MENPNECWPPPPPARAPAENPASFDASLRSVLPDDLYNNFSELLNFDSYAGWCNSPVAPDQVSSTFGFNSLPSMVYAQLDGSSFIEQDVDPLPSSFNPQFEADEPVAEQNGDSFQGNGQMSRGVNVYQPTRCLLDEKMLRALSFVKESSGGGILAQVWVPVKRGEEWFLSTSDQPYLLDQMLAGFREVSRMYTFSAEGKPGCVLGLPGRVFTSKVPEWTSDVSYYQKNEYVRSEHALSHHVRGSIALPVFEPDSRTPCCAVLELVTTKEKPNFDREMEIVCHALQAVNLKTNSHPQLVPQCLSNSQKEALAEIVDVLRAVCHAHRLPLALTWIPCCYGGGNDQENSRLRVREGKMGANEKCILCIEQTACYVNDTSMQGFAHACMEHHFEVGQGLAGKALQSNLPFFFPDVKTYDINEYPLVHHARKFGLNAAVAIRLRSTYTGDCDYILEFFLPVNMKGASEQQLLLNNLSGTMQRICKSLRTVSEVELVGVDSDGACERGPVLSGPSLSRENSHMAVSDGDLNSIDEHLLKLPNRRTSGTEADSVREQKSSGSRRQAEKKRSTSEKTVSLSVLQHYFSGSLKDAAKSIGVCPTTLKRICRQHGISRWPSRKINKVNRSLRKIQTVLDSVHGVEGGLKFDPSTGGLVTTNPVPQEFDPTKNHFFMENNNNNNIPSLQTLDPLSAIKLEGSDDALTMLNSYKRSKFENLDEIALEQNRPASSSMTDSSNGSGSLLHGSSSSSHSSEERKQPKAKPSFTENGSKIIVKATYKDDTVRFKFDTAGGCCQLYDEIAQRFRLLTGAFQLKYLDDEDEWVMLVSDMDLQECLEILEDVGTRTVKFQVRDLPCAVGSSGSSNCFLAPGS